MLGEVQGQGRSIWNQWLDLVGIKGEPHMSSSIPVACCLFLGVRMLDKSRLLLLVEGKEWCSGTILLYHFFGPGGGKLFYFMMVKCVEKGRVSWAGGFFSNEILVL